jgi:hypothetical protein
VDDKLFCGNQYSTKEDAMEEQFVVIPVYCVKCWNIKNLKEEYRKEKFIKEGFILHPREEALQELFRKRIVAGGEVFRPVCKPYPCVVEFRKGFQFNQLILFPGSPPRERKLTGESNIDVISLASGFIRNCDIGRL